MNKQPCVAVIGSGYWGKNLVRNYHELGALKLVDAPRAFPLGLQLARRFVAPRLALAAIDLERGAVVEAAAAYGELLKKYPDHGGALLGRALAAIDQGRGAEVLDDVRLAERVRDAGLRIRLWWAPWAFRVRLYRSLAEIVAGYRKNVYEGLGRRAHCASTLGPHSARTTALARSRAR